MRLGVFSAILLVGLFGLGVALHLVGRRAKAVGKSHDGCDGFFAALVDRSADMITVVGADGLIAYDSPSTEPILGYRSERVGSPILDSVHPDDRAGVRARFEGEWPSDGTSTDEIRVRHRDGSWRWVEGVWSNLLEVPEVAGIVVTWREVGERKALQERLFGDREFLTAVLESLEDGVVACDANGVLTLFNDATRRFHGLPADSLPAEEWADHYDLFLPDQTTRMGRDDIPLFRALAGEEVRQAEMVIAPKGGRLRVMQATGRAIFAADGTKLGAVVAMHDTTERKEAAVELARQAFTDLLTGLGNRASLTALLEQAVQRAAITGSPLAVLIIDLDDFKKVNDSLGHAAGNLLLTELAGRLRASLHPLDVVARLGGDEFAVVLEDRSEDEAILVADRLLAAIQAPFDVEHSEVTMNASIGIALGRGARESGDRLLRAADLAMYVAKSRGKGGWAVFEPTMHVAALGRLALEADLRRALAGDQLSLAYQPVVSLATGEMVGVEALLRWNPPGGRPITPDEFLPVAEDSGLILPIGAWVLEQACSQLVRWDKAHPERPHLTVAVNLSVRQLQRDGFINILVDVLERTGLQADRLVLEITESALMSEDTFALTMLREIDLLGVKLSIDDFGTGYSSLSRLRTLPIAAVKIDRSFIHDIDGPDTQAPLVVAALAMAKGLGLSVVAEGIETTDQLDFLCHHGCPEAQGFLMSRPVGADAITLLLEQASPLLDLRRDAGRPPVTLDEEMSGSLAPCHRQWGIVR